MGKIFDNGEAMFYHVSIVELKDEELYFMPRVPHSRLEEENESVERICVFHPQ